uniref:F-box domain-containing protein n=1 Tax=Caenorhabditis tropicalis TaxID=1561998 RepID=A0A1I7TAG1_9PELO
MNSKPLTYNCLESVIKHTDLNKRLQLKARCSSIKQLESNVPLEIDTLDFYGDHLVVNGTEYRIGVIQKWPNSQVPNYAKLELMNGGCFNDLNEFGARCSDESVDLMPGDIDMMKKRPRYKDPRIIPNPVDIDIAEKEENIKFYKKELEKLRSVWGTTIFSFDELKEFKKKNDIFYDKHYANRRGYSANNKEQEALDVQKKLILNIFREKRKLQCSINKRDNIHPEFLVLLTMKSPTGEKRVEYGKYTGKLHDSQKGLLSFILGDRSCSVNVKKLILSNESVIRVPIGLKLKIQELEIISDYDLTRFEVLFNKLKPILDESSIPLRSLEFRSIRVKDFNHEANNTTLLRTPKVDHFELKTPIIKGGPHPFSLF